MSREYLIPRSNHTELLESVPCGLQYLNPRLRGDLILSGYTEGEDATYVSGWPRERTFSAALAEIERLVGAPGRLFDIGTAADVFVTAAKTRGWMAEGCEPNRWLAEWGARDCGIRIHQGNVFDHDCQPGSFDVVTLWDVLELDYILFRASVLSSRVLIAARALFRLFGIGRAQGPYWLGQTFIAARRVGGALILAMAISA